MNYTGAVSTSAALQHGFDKTNVHKEKLFWGRFCFNISILSQPLWLSSVPHYPIHTHTYIYVYVYITYICACMFCFFYDVYAITDGSGGEAFFFFFPHYVVDVVPSPPASCGTTPIILCRCLERTNVYCYYKAAFVVIACAPCPLLLVSALLSFCVGLGGGREGGGVGWGRVG